MSQTFLKCMLTALYLLHSIDFGVLFRRIGKIFFGSFWLRCENGCTQPKVIKVHTGTCSVEARVVRLESPPLVRRSPLLRSQSSPPHFTRQPSRTTTVAVITQTVVNARRSLAHRTCFHKGSGQHHQQVATGAALLRSLLEGVEVATEGPDFSGVCRAMNASKRRSNNFNSSSSVWRPTHPPSEVLELLARPQLHSVWLMPTVCPPLLKSK